MGKLSGNKGEWGELYAALKIAVDGVLQGVDVDLEPLTGRCLKVLQVIRPDFLVNTGLTLQFAKNSDGKMYSRHLAAENVIFSIENSVFSKRVGNLLSKVKTMSANNQPNGDTDIATMMDEIGCCYLSADSRNKKDLLLRMHDPFAGGDVDYGFSVKSYIGAPPTLMNASGQTSLKFEVNNADRIDQDRISALQNSKSKEKYKEMITELNSAGATLSFSNFDKENFRQNLRQLDDGLPDIYAEAIRLFEETGESNIDEIFKKIEEKDFKQYGPGGKSFYRKKFKRFLVASALGMQPEVLWDDVDDATGGFVIVEPNGEIAAFYITDRCKFENYLMMNTSFVHPTASRKRASGGINNPNRVWMFEKQTVNGEEKMFVHFNAQIRFKNNSACGGR